MTYSKISHFIKYTGSKRILAPFISEYIPNDIPEICEPFCGSASLSLTLMANNHNVGTYYLYDKNTHIVNLLKMCKDNPDKLIDTYSVFWRDLQNNPKQVYSEYRKEFNTFFQPDIFLCLIRTCVNGITRFNSLGEFNVSLHHSRPGIHPKKLSSQILNISSLLNANKVVIANRSYVEAEHSLYFLDPPYKSTSSLYQGSFNFIDFEKWLIDKKFLLTYGEADYLPYTKIDLPSLNSSHSRILSGKGQNNVSENLYINLE